MGNNLAEILGILFGLTAVGVVIKLYNNDNKHKTLGNLVVHPINALSGENFGGGKTKKNKKHKK